MKKFFSWFFKKSQSKVEENPLYDNYINPNISIIKSLEKQIIEKRQQMDHLAMLDLKTARDKENSKPKYRLFIITDKETFKTKECLANISSIIDYYEDYYGSSSFFYEENGTPEERKIKRLTQMLNLISSRIITIETSKEHALRILDSIKREPGYFDEKSNTYIPANEIKRIKIVQA